MANISLIVSSVLFVVVYASAAPPIPGGSPLDHAAGLYSNLWGGIDAEAAKQACRDQGYGTPIQANPKTIAKRGLLDGVIPTVVADGMGSLHKFFTTESMAEHFCAKQGLGKNVQSNQNYVPVQQQTNNVNNNGQQLQLPNNQKITWTIQHGTGKPKPVKGNTIDLPGNNAPMLV